MIIKVPNLDMKSAMKFCYELRKMVLEEGERCSVDFSAIKNCDPFPMLIVSNELSRFRKNHSRNEFIAQHCVHKYAKYMKFYKACGIGDGEAVDIDRHKGGYSTITRLSVKALREEGIESNSIIQEVIDNRAKTMAGIVAQGNDKFQKWLAFALREMIRNIPEHSESDDIWYCAQYWPFYDLVELAILDEGIGIKESLLRGGKIGEKSEDAEALKTAIEPGVSGAGTHIFDEDWQNSGYGLYMVSQMCVELGGSFTIASGDAGLTLYEELGEVRSKESKTHIKGTAIRIQVKPSNAPDYESIRRNILKRGEERAKSIKNSIHSASKASRGFE